MSFFIFIQDGMIGYGSKPKFAVRPLSNRVQRDVLRASYDSPYHAVVHFDNTREIFSSIKAKILSRIPTTPKQSKKPFKIFTRLSKKPSITDAKPSKKTFTNVVTPFSNVAYTPKKSSDNSINTFQNMKTSKSDDALYVEVLVAIDYQIYE